MSGGGGPSYRLLSSTNAASVTLKDGDGTSLDSETDGNRVAALVHDETLHILLRDVLLELKLMRLALDEALGSTITPEEIEA